MIDNELITKAFIFAAKAHKDQKRKYTGDPYIIHPYSVAFKIWSVTKNVNMTCAALLHDTIEDTDVEYDDIKDNFGVEIADLVVELTDVTVLSDGNRKKRKSIERDRLSKVSPEAKAIKLADLIDNSQSIIEHGGDFTDVFMGEFHDLLNVLNNSNEDLLIEASDIHSMYFSFAGC